MGCTGDHYRLSVLMLPWLAHGHASPFLELAKRLSSRHHVLVHFCSSPANLVSIRDQLDAKAYPSIRLVELHLPALHSLPTDLHTTKHLPTHLMPTLKRAFDLAEPDFLRLLAVLSPDLLIYDFLQPWAPLAARRHGIRAVQFLTTAAASAAFFCHHIRRPDEEFPFPALCLGVKENLENTERMNRFGNGVADSERFFHCMERSTGFILIRTFREIESKYIDYFARVIGKEVVPVGALVPDDDPLIDRPVMEWLDARKTSSSVVLAAFGTEYFMCGEEIREIARGLDLSGMGFIWVLRFPTEDGKCRSRSGALPNEFMERAVKGKQGRGLVIEGWVPQRGVLAHPSVGGFLTHCGWSSVVEAMHYGVPIVALPLQLDQPANAKLVEELGVGREVKKASGPLGGFTGEEVAAAIRAVVIGEEGERVRRRARQIARLVSRKGEEEMVEVVEKMVNICEAAKSRDRSSGLM